jgi:hypothetical protein
LQRQQVGEGVQTLQGYVIKDSTTPKNPSMPYCQHVARAATFASALWN